MIACLDSTVLARAYLVDEDGHQQASGLLADPDIATVTGTWDEAQRRVAEELRFVPM